MIIEVNNDQKTIILSYIGNSYYKCLYLYIDIQKYGCSSEMTKTWKQTANGEITSVMLAYHSALHIYSKRMEFDVKELKEFIINNNPSIVCACADLIKLLAPALLTNGYASEYGHIGKHTRIVHHQPNKNVSVATEKDIKEIAKLLYEDEDIGASYTLTDLVKQIKERLNDGFVRSYVIREDGHVVAHLGTGAETEKLCTISYVITAPEHRGKGLSSSLFTYACNKLTSEGKEIYSVYYPDNSRQLHHKMGFEDCCEFGKLYRNIQ